MRFVVLGAGAIGGSAGGRLSLAGHDVVLIARGAHLAAIRANGLRIEAPDGIAVANVAAVESPKEIAWKEGDVVLVGVKTQAVAAALADLAAAAPLTTPIVCMTNGLETERLALRWFRDVHGVCVMSPTSFMTPGIVQQWSSPGRGVLDIGRYPEGTNNVDTHVAAAFKRAGYESEARADIFRWKRGKLLNNLANAIEALCGLGPASHELVKRTTDEGIACFEAAGLSRITEAEDASRRTHMKVGNIAGAVRGGGSTWQSLARGARDVECDYLNGEIVLLGRLHGVPTPVNEALQRLVANAAREGRAAGAITPGDVLAHVM